jgi:hypothetical protein
MTSLLLKRYDGQIFTLDLMEIKDFSEIKFWVNKKSIDPVHPAGNEVFRIHTLINQ